MNHLFLFLRARRARRTNIISENYRQMAHFHPPHQSRAPLFTLWRLFRAKSKISHRYRVRCRDLLTILPLPAVFGKGYIQFSSLSSRRKSISRAKSTTMKKTKVFRVYRSQTMGLLGTTHRAEDEQLLIVLAVELRRPGALNWVHGMPYGTGLLKRNAIDIGKQCREYFAALNWNMLAIYDTNVLIRLHVDWADYSR